MKNQEFLVLQKTLGIDLAVGGYISSEGMKVVIKSRVWVYIGNVKTRKNRCWRSLPKVRFFYLTKRPIRKKVFALMSTDAVITLLGNNKEVTRFIYRLFINIIIDGIEMSGIHKIGEEYYVEFKARGLTYQQKAGTDLKKAEDLLRQIEDKIAKGELQTIVREIERDVFFAEFLKYARTQYHPYTVRRLSLALEHFEKFLTENLPDVRRLSQITPRVIEDYKTSHIAQRSKDGLNPKIINLTLLLLREVLEHGIKTGYINDNPTLHIKLLEIPAGRSLTITDEALVKVLEYAPECYRPIFSFLRQAGLRLQELERLNWQQVDLNRGVIFIKYREVPLNAAALNLTKTAFHNVIDFKAPVFPDSDGQAPCATEIAVRFDKACQKAGLKGLNASMLRHSFACDLLRKRVSFLTIGKILGVHDIAKLMIYASCIPVSREEMYR